MFKGCLYCGHESLTENQLFMREEYGETKWMHLTGRKVGGDVVMYSCDECGFLHPFNKGKRKKFERESSKRRRDIRWNIR
ncbi:hypothetical protein CN378_13660 [Bacillus sp. AFS015802]|uniref:hypothetical protein n=1 Tax=Bacillus sp. AFS015802 TaxID=2033486 RepID=UPI000BF3F2D0|nr:hypothetical protein [Bacillus sp. AFS015802]PFA66344.1 hypothetical protein CN378_13660 [Bacillus sp. AFS015802]